LPFKSTTGDTEDTEDDIMLKIHEPLLKTGMSWAIELQLRSEQNSSNYLGLILFVLDRDIGKVIKTKAI
jgi:hypothetical protein